MNSIRILIADTNEDMCNILGALLSRRYRVRLCGNGRVARELLHSFLPDILVLELILPEIDGLFLINEAFSLPTPPLIVLMTRLDTGYVQQKFTSLRIAKLLRKPCDLVAAEGYIHEIAQQLSSNIQDQATVETETILQALGFPIQRAGYRLLRAAIPLYLQDSAQPIFKVIYSQAATIAEVSDNPKAVDKAIAKVIQAAWCGESRELWLELFPLCHEKAPSNKVFIARVAERIKHGK